MVKDGQTGRLVPPADSTALAQAITEILRDRASWSKLGAAGRALVEQNYNINTLNDRLVRHYRSLLACESP
jgi:glycosyltransferase involved in cell wall biosynthesis